MKYSQQHIPAQYVQLIGRQTHIYSHGKHYTEAMAPRDLRDAARKAIESAHREQDGEPVSFGLAHGRATDKLGRNQKKYGVLS